MKYINKFIAAGLGFALVFTGTNFAHGWFTSSAKQENIVTIPKPNIQLDVSKAYFSGKDTGGVKYGALYIPVNILGIDESKLKLEAKLESKKDNTTIQDDYISFGKGVHNTGHDEYENDTEKYCLIIQLPNGLEFGVKEKFNITITAKTKIDGYEIFKGEYWLQKQDQSNDCNGLEGRIQHIPMNNGHTNLDSKESIFIEKEDIYKEEEKLTESEVVEQSKEEMEDLIKQESTESPKEKTEEFVEQEEEMPKQPEVIALPKETEETQE